MPTRSVRSALLLLLGSALVASLACTSNPSLPTGVARVVVRPLVAETYIARMTVTVSKGLGNPDFAPIVAELTRSETQWNGRVPGVPAGSQREFDVLAFDSQGNGLFAAFGHGDIAAGAATVVSLTLDNRAPPNYQNAFPVIDSVSWSPDPPAPSSAVQFRVTAHDPNAAGTLTYHWSADCGSFDNADTAAPRWTAPAQPGICHVSIAVTNSQGATVGYDFAVTVTSSTGGAGVTVTVNSWPVIASLGGALTVQGSVMDGDLMVQASDPDGDALSYSWESNCSGINFKLTAPYGVTTPHITLPVSSTPCTVTVSVFDGISPAATTGTLYLYPEVVRLNCQNVVCPQGQTCDPLDGICKSCTPSCPANSCGPNGCGGTCTCPAGSSCGASNLCVATCTPSCAANSCGPNGCGGTCTCPGGSSCGANNQCVCTPSCPANSCGPDGCGGTCRCSGGATCNANGQCVSGGTLVIPLVARDLQINPPASLSSDVGGNTYVTGSIAINVAANFQTNPSKPPIYLKSANGFPNIFAAKYDGTGNIVYGVTIGDDDPTATTAQTATGSAISSDGKFILIGKIAGTVTFGANVVLGASAVPYLAALSGTDGTRLWARSYGLGSNGSLNGVSANPGSTSHGIAVCGAASIAATQLVPGTTFGGGTTDLVIAMFDSAGNKLWAQQIGGPGNESCASVAVDDNGDVFAAGQFDGASLAFCSNGTSSNGAACTGTITTLTGPNTTVRKFMWVAKFAGGTGNTLAAVAYSGSAGVASPQSLAVSPTGDVFVGGSWSGALTIGAPLTNQGQDDAFVAKLDHATLAPVWSALSWGGEGIDRVRGVASTSSGDVIAVGFVNPSSTAFRSAHGGADTAGAVALTVTGNSSPDIFVVKFNGQTGATDGGATYGDAATQTGDSVAVNRFSAANQIAFSGLMAGLSSATFGAAGTITAATGPDSALVFAQLR